MVIGNIHDILKDIISKIVNALAMGLDVDCLDSGQATWRTMIRGLEADLSYYFDAEKIRVAQEAWVRDSRTRTTFPIPTWRSRSTCLLLKSIGRRSIEISESSRSGGLSGARRSLSSSSSRTGRMPRSRKAGSCGSAPRTSFGG